MSSSRSFFVLPITSAASFNIDQNVVVLVGEGPFIRVFLARPPLLVSTIQVFETQAVHGIHCFQKTLPGDQYDIICVAWGGYSLHFFELRARPTSATIQVSVIPIYPEKRQSDWILDAKFIPGESENVDSVVFLNAHNDLYYVGYPGTSSGNVQADFEVFSKGPPSALYSGFIDINEDKQVLVASGTVFGGVHLWKANRINSTSCEGKLLMVYSGHEGSVYGIRISTIVQKKQKKLVIISCSDDRSVKVWSMLENVSSDQFGVPFLGIQTGFDRASDSTIFTPPLASANGHLSRIWRVGTVSCNNVTGLITYGEDATAQLWAVEFDEDLDHLGLLKDSLLNLHTGKNVWAGETVVENPAISWIVTGGADGRVTLNDVRTQFRHSTRAAFNSIERKSLDIDQFRGYCWFDNTCLLAVTSDGKVFLGEMKGAGESLKVDWRSVGQAEDLARYTLMEAFSSGYALLAGSTGNVHLVERRTGTMRHILTFDRKVSFFAGTQFGDVKLLENTTIVIQCLGSTKLLVSRLSPDIDQEPMDSSSIFSIDLPEGFVVTCAYCLSCNMIIVGSRNGRMAIYQLSDAGVVEECFVSTDVHGRDAVTKIIPLQVGNWILSTGRDGCLKAHKISFEATKLSLETSHSSKLPFGPDIEGVKISSGQVYAWGFRGQSLVLWNHTIKQEVSSIDCGSQHRSWSFCYGNPSAMVWTRAGQPHLAQLPSASSVLLQGSHGREIKALAIRNNQDTLGKLIATGAEDTCIRLSKFDNENQLKTLEVVPTHITGLQKLRWSEDGRFLFSAAGKEEFHVWEIQPVPLLEIGVKLVASAPPITETRILRIMDFDVVEKDGFILAMVYSDSSIRSWSFHPVTHRFELLQEIIYSTCCITQCKILGQCLLTAATDGCLVLWDRNANNTKLLQKRIHQSSIKCLACIGWAYGKLIATGGDDNALALTYVTFQPVPKWHTVIIPNAHASALNGLTFLPRNDDEVQLLTTSNDQQIKVWSVKDQMYSEPFQDVTIQRTSCASSSVADASCVETMEIDHSVHVVIAGIGLEFWVQDTDAHE